MAVTHKWTLLCDEVRQENNGKYIIIGLYTPDVAVSQLPALLPSLTFFVCLESDRPENITFRLALQQLETGQPIAQGMGAFAFQRPGLGMFPIRLGNLQIAAAGAYTFSLTLDGQREPLTHSFNVLLNVAPPGAQQNFPALGR